MAIGQALTITFKTTNTHAKIMNTFKKIANAMHKFGDGLTGATIGTASGEFLSGIGLQEFGSTLTDYGDRSISSAAEATPQVPIIGESLIRRTYNVLSEVRTVSRVIGKGTAYFYNKKKTN